MVFCEVEIDEREFLHGGIDPLAVRRFCVMAELTAVFQGGEDGEGLM